MTVPNPPADFLAAVTMVGERAAAGYGWQKGYAAGVAAGRKQAAEELMREVNANPVYGTPYQLRWLASSVLADIAEGRIDGEWPEEHNHAD